MREERRSPRLTPLRAAWLTYTARRSYWLIGLSLVVWHAAQWIEWRVNGRTSSVALPDLDRSGPVWSMAGRSAQQAGAESARYADLMGELPVFRREYERTGFPQLETLLVIAQVAPADLELIARLPKLRELTLMQTAGLSAADLSLLAASTSLKALRIYDNRGYREATGPIAWPPNLEFLAFISPQGPLPPERIAELSRLPRLQRLSTELRGERWGLPPDPAILERLRTFPALERLDLYEFEERDPLLGQVQRALPRVMVRPTFFEGTRLRRGWGASTWLWFFLAALLGHVSTQFVGTQAVILPGFTRPHVYVCVGLLLLGLGAQGALLIAAGFGFVGAVGWLGASLAIFGVLLEGIRRIEPGLPGLANPYISFPLIMAPVGMLPLMLAGAGGEWDWFARGQLPWWTCAWVVLACGFAYRQGVWLSGLARSQERFGRGGVPLGGFKVTAWREYELARLRNTSGASWSFRDWATGGHGQLERALRASGTKPAWLGLNRAADQVTTGRFLLVMSSFLVVFMGLGWLCALPMASAPHIRDGMLKGSVLGIGTQFIVMPLFFPWGLLWTRKPQLGMELLRPISRRDWVRGWFRDMAGRMLPCLATTGLVLSVATMVEAVPPLSITQWGLVIAATGGVMLLSLGLGCWIVTWRHGMLAMLFPVLLTGPFLALAVLAPHLSPDEDLLTHPATPWLALGVLYVVGAGSIALAYRRWQRWELGRLS